MGFKVLPVLFMFMAAILLISAEVQPNEYENSYKKDGKPNPNGVYESKGYYGGWGGPWYGGWGGPYYRGGWGWGGPWRGGWGWGWGGWRPNEHVEAGINANPHN